MSLVVVSPHLDDAIFSCGTLIAAASLAEPALIVTVCAGVPDEDAPLSNLDRGAGFGSAHAGVTIRRAEDEAAARVLGARVLHLDVLDGQHDPSSGSWRPSRIRVAVEKTVGRLKSSFGGVVVAPAGMRHADHLAVAAACEPYAALWYEELPYRVLWPETRPTWLGAPFLELPSCPLKAEAILCYRSQLGDGPPGLELAAPERYHRAIA